MSKHNTNNSMTTMRNMLPTLLHRFQRYTKGHHYYHRKLQQ
jgi:hypothetical protein